jgi:hypothetical protein
MALVGALTLQALGRAYLRDLPGRVEGARRRLAGVEPSVLVDRVATTVPAGPAATGGAR